VAPFQLLGSLAGEVSFPRLYSNSAPKIVVEQTFKLYADNPKSVTEYHEFEGRGHSLAIDKDWDDVANVTLEWLSSKGF
jgi:esterase/lipase